MAILNPWCSSPLGNRTFSLSMVLGYHESHRLYILSTFLAVNNIKIVYVNGDDRAPIFFPRVHEQVILCKIMRKFEEMGGNLILTKVGSSTSRAILTSKNLNDVHNSDKLKNPAVPSYGGFSSLSTGAAEILIFVVSRVPLQFFISRDVAGSPPKNTL